MTEWLPVGNTNFLHARMHEILSTIAWGIGGSKFPRTLGNQIWVTRVDDVSATRVRIPDALLSAVAAEVAADSGILSDDDRTTLIAAWASRTNVNSETPIVPESLGFLAGNYPIVLYIGQSNAVGMRPTYTITSWPTEQRQVQRSCLATWMLNDGSYQNAQSFGWEPLRPPTQNDGTESVKGTPGLSFAARLHTNLPKFALFHWGVGATCLYPGTGNPPQTNGSWDPATGRVWENFRRYFRHALDTFPFAGHLAAIIWDHGESDCILGSGPGDTSLNARSLAYQENLVGFITEIRALVGNVPFIIREMDPNYTPWGTTVGTTRVLAAQQWVAANIPMVSSVSGVGFLSGSPDGTHCTAVNCQTWASTLADAVHTALT
jgi:hypothetical protein